MKNIIISILFVYAFNTHAQTIVPVEDYLIEANLKADNIYFKDLNHTFDKFLGNWEYNDGTHYVKINITKMVKEDWGNTETDYRWQKLRHYHDYILVRFLYKFNGQTVYNTLPHLTIEGQPTPQSVIKGKVIRNPNLIWLSYNEPSTTTCMRSRFGDLALTFLPNPTNTLPPTLQWDRTDKLSYVPASLCEDGIFDVSEYKIPASMVFTKTP